MLPVVPVTETACCLQWSNVDFQSLYVHCVACLCRYVTAALWQHCGSRQAKVAWDCETASDIDNLVLLQFASICAVHYGVSNFLLAMLTGPQNFVYMCMHATT